MNAWTTLCLMAATTITLAGDASAVRKDKAALQGTWRVVASEQDGEKVPADDLKDLFLIFKEDAIQIREGTKSEEKFRFAIDPARNPKEMDLTILFGPKKGMIDRAIYTIDGNTLRICIQSNKDSPRPRDFSTRPASKLWLVVLERSK